jgi:hypothetical protein
MSYGLSICWRGPPGSGKRYALQSQLEAWAKSMGQIYVVKRHLWDAPLQGGEVSEDEKEDEADEKALLPMESSIVQWGFDVARMSLQDKQYVKSILQRWGRGSQVLSQSTSTSQRCLVFYHAHLLSNESVLFLQAFLEENHQDSVLWLTSEHPLPTRLADWCAEIPVPGKDRMIDILQARTPTESIVTIEDEIHSIYEKWMHESPKLSDVKKIRAIVYALLHRNIRWCDGFHMWMFALDRLQLTNAQRKTLAAICVKQPFTGAGQTVPSYRIPVLWENYLCLIRNALAPAPTPEELIPITPVKKLKKKKGDATPSF